MIVSAVLYSNSIIALFRNRRRYILRKWSQKVKQLLTQLGADFEVLELDEMSDGGEIQSALSKWTRQGTVPNVFIKGKHMGGCDRVMEVNQKGKLVPLLVEAGALAKISSKL